MNLDKDPEFVASYLRADFIENIYQYANNNNISLNEIREKLHWSKKKFDCFINEDDPLTEDIIAEVSCKLGIRIKIEFNPMSVYGCIRETKDGLSIEIIVDEHIPIDKDLKSCVKIDTSAKGAYFLGIHS